MVAQRLSVFGISIVAFIGVVVQGPIACALHCMGIAEFAHAPVLLEHDGHLGHHPVGEIGAMAAHVAAHVVASPTTTDASDTGHCPSLDAAGPQMASASTPRAINDSRLSDMEPLQPHPMSLQLNLDGPSSPSGVFAPSLERPPTA